MISIIFASGCVAKYSSSWMISSAVYLVAVACLFVKELCVAKVITLSDGMACILLWDTASAIQYQSTNSGSAAQYRWTMHQTTRDIALVWYDLVNFVSFICVNTAIAFPQSWDAITFPRVSVFACAFYPTKQPCYVGCAMPLVVFQIQPLINRGDHTWSTLAIIISEAANASASLGVIVSTVLFVTWDLFYLCKHGCALLKGEVNLIQIHGKKMFCLHWFHPPQLCK